MGYPIGNYTDEWNWENSQYELLGGGDIPEEGCGAPPVGCLLAITGTSVTDVTVRGDDDGSIYVGTTGATGTTYFYINGALGYSGTNDTFTFTGLTAGIYDIAVQDSHVPPCYVTALDLVVEDGEFRTGDFVVQAPTGLTAVENPIIIDVATKVNTPNPKNSVTTLTVAGTLADGFSLKFNLTSPYVYSQTFYAKSYPSKPNYFLASTLTNQYGTPAGTNSLTEICTSLAEVLQNDSVIPKVYYVNNSGTVVTLAAKETGSRLNLSSSNVIASTTGITVTQTQVGTDYCDGQITDNYSISCEVMANTDVTNQYPQTGQTTDFNRIAELILPFNPSNIHRFDISSILKSQVSTPMPNMNMTGATMLPTVMQPYYVKLSELYPLVPNTNTIKKRYKTETGVQWVINSALDRYAANNMQEHIELPVEFLTNSPSPKQIQRSGNEFLYFILPRDYGTDLDCRGDMYFYDGTQVTGVTFFDISTGGTNAGGCLILNISYDKLGLGAYEVSGSTNRKIKRLDLAIYASGGTIQYTETKSYRFEIDEMPRKFGVLFQGQHGTYDSFDFIGTVEETISRTSDTYTIPLNYNTNGSISAGQRNVATYNTKIVKKISVNTGWIDSDHFDWLMEMIQSNNIYSTESANQNYLNLVEYDYKKSSLEDLFSIDITFDWTIYENNVTV